MAKHVTDGLRSDRGNAEHWDEPSDLVYVKEVGVYLTRASWHVKDGEWAARNADGEVRRGTADSNFTARSQARGHSSS
jgi:hypothetical protein